ncbi:uncharacterized protein BDR25DRAFT_353153 [Lindgomyces ingoldianus]|uniref:Uncharacterized protein n=1 Tax=Lindgomyces ingoldianus TaxID=673940 RepID=A0ACB6R223_9PLEO|nr:uncharacterized protein BDR25DRAFT_353153 [Lindgomyces ingoldianus]KAF2472840.1 hypothetical protein BDR25DRAFT_353153 [Lindgomyces ingoldianus]
MIVDSRMNNFKPDQRLCLCFLYWGLPLRDKFWGSAEARREHGREQGQGMCAVMGNMTATHNGLPPQDLNLDPNVELPQGRMATWQAPQGLKSLALQLVYSRSLETSLKPMNSKSSTSFTVHARLQPSLYFRTSVSSLDLVVLAHYSMIKPMATHSDSPGQSHNVGSWLEFKENNLNAHSSTETLPPGDLTVAITLNCIPATWVVILGRELALIGHERRSPGRWNLWYFFRLPRCLSAYMRVNGSHVQLAGAVRQNTMLRNLPPGDKRVQPSLMCGSVTFEQAIERLLHPLPCQSYIIHHGRWFCRRQGQRTAFLLIHLPAHANIIDDAQLRRFLQRFPNRPETGSDETQQLNTLLDPQEYKEHTNDDPGFPEGLQSAQIAMQKQINWRIVQGQPRDMGMGSGSSGSGEVDHTKEVKIHVQALPNELTEVDLPASHSRRSSRARNEAMEENDESVPGGKRKGVAIKQTSRHLSAQHIEISILSN